MKTDKDIKMFFKSGVGRSELFSVEKGRQKLTLFLCDKDGMPTNCFDARIIKPMDERKAGLCKNIVIFKDIQDGTDMLCTIEGTTVKCDVVVKRNVSFKGCSFLVDCNNVFVAGTTLNLAEFVRFKEVFYIAKAFMYDAEAAIYSEVLYKTKVFDKGRFKLEMLPIGKLPKSENEILPLLLHFEICFFGDNF